MNNNEFRVIIAHNSEFIPAGNALLHCGTNVCLKAKARLSLVSEPKDSVNWKRGID